MTIVYCDMSGNDAHEIYAWGCLVIHNGVEHVFSGHCLMDRALRNGEIYALISSLEALSSFDVKKVKVYTEDASVVLNFKAMKNGQEPKLKGYYSRYFKYLCGFAHKYNLDLRKIPRNQNRAHDIANAEMRYAVNNLQNVKPAVIPGYLQPPQSSSTKAPSEPKSPLSIIRSCIPQSLRKDGDFNTHILRILKQCAKQEHFHELLLSQGVSLSSFYQLLKNRFPKKISYKQNGEKKLHMSFSRALLNSKFCVCEINGLYFIFYYDNRPDSAFIVDCSVTKIHFDEAGHEDMT